MIEELEASSYELELKQAQLLEVFETNRSRLFHTLFRRSQDHAMVEDVMQDTFIKAFEKIHEFRGESELYTWLHRIAINTLINAMVRKRLILIEDLVGDNSRDHFEPWIEDVDVCMRLTEQQAAQAIDKDRNSDTHTDLVWLRYYEGLSPQKVARLTETPEGSVKSGTHRGLKKLKIKHAKWAEELYEQKL